MDLSQIVRNSFVHAVLILGFAGCGSSNDPSCREGRIYKEGVGCVEETPTDYNNVDAGSRNRGSIDTSVAPQDTYVAPQDGSADVQKDTYVAPQDGSADVQKDTYVAPQDGSADVPKDTSCAQKKYYFDDDGDGFGNPNDFKFLCAPNSIYKLTNGDDCDDNDYAVNPNANEDCNGKDDDCDGKTDMLKKSCKTDCGSGLEYCINAKWSDCQVSESCSTDVLGDVNCDGKVNQADLDQVTNYWKGNITKFTTADGSECVSGLKNADLDCDGKPAEDNDLSILIGYVKNGNTNSLKCPVDTLNLGDVNCDKTVNIQDTLAVVDYIIGSTTEFKKANGNICTTGKEAADTNCDGNIDIQDVNAITDYILGNPTFFPGCESRIAMVCGSKKEILKIISLDGKVTGEYFYTTPVADPSWSFDHKKIAFSTKIDGVEYIAVRDLTTGKTKGIQSNCKNPDFYGNDKLAMICGDAVYVTDASGENDALIKSGYGQLIGLSWAYNGTRVSLDINPYDSNAKTPGVNVLNVSLGAPQLIKNQPQFCTFSDWHPSTNEVVMACQSSAYGISNLYITGIDGSGLKKLTTDNDGDFIKPSWSPDANLIAFENYGKGIYVLNLKDSSITKIPNVSSDCKMPAFSH
ncbi:hypothetical protein HQ489_03950 [Candidatus Woesearchaeota archaeon]|nr:hypothetical protein [Candidatus Woesearchaeota archaeon]